MLRDSESSATDLTYITLPPIRTLILVCCHAIFLNHPLKPTEDEGNWLLAPFQTGEVPTFIQHMKAGLQLLSENPNAILIFSGGPTKPDLTDRSEAQGYCDAVERNQFFGFKAAEEDIGIRQRCFHDTYATDSFQNVLFSLLQFPACIQALSQSHRTHRNVRQYLEQPRWPEKLVIVSHEFKRARFMELHLPAIRFPVERVEFVGIDPPFNEVKMAEIRQGDRIRGYGAWKGDLYGRGYLLKSKRESRGWTEARRGKFDREVFGGLGSEMGVMGDLMGEEGDVGEGGGKWKMGWEEE